MRRFVVGGIGSVLVAASAWGTNLAIRRAVQVPEVVREAAAPRVASRGPVPSVGTYVDGILARNLFDAASIGLTREPLPSFEGLRMTLLGTSVAEPEAYSSALILDEDSRDLPRAYSVGGRVKGLAVVSIEARRVGLAKEDGEVAYLLLEPRGVATDDAGPEVARTLERRVLEEALADPASLARLGRIGPHRGPDGAIDGYRLSGLRQGTLPDALGLQNGDVVHTIDGQALSPALLGTLAGASRLCVGITRRGAPTELCFDVR